MPTPDPWILVSTTAASLRLMADMLVNLAESHTHPMMSTPQEPIAEAVTDQHLGRCTVCGRKTWDPASLGNLCRMLGPSPGTTCSGVFVADPDRQPTGTCLICSREWFGPPNMPCKACVEGEHKPPNACPDCGRPWSGSKKTPCPQCERNYTAYERLDPMADVGPSPGVDRPVKTEVCVMQACPQCGRGGPTSMGELPAGEKPPSWATHICGTCLVLWDIDRAELHQHGPNHCPGCGKQGQMLVHGTEVKDGTVGDLSIFSCGNCQAIFDRPGRQQQVNCPRCQVPARRVMTISAATGKEVEYSEHYPTWRAMEQRRTVGDADKSPED